MRELNIGANDAGQRLDKYLHKYLKEATNGFIYKMLRKKNIVLNDAKADGHEIVSEGDSVKLWLSEETIEKFRGAAGAEGRNFGDSYASWDEIPSLKSDEIVYEDKDILVMDKPVGELSQKAKPDDISINERMLSYLKKSGVWEPSGTFTPGICNRLDRNTGGIILAGKTLKGTQVLSELIKYRKIRKFYHTVVERDVSHTFSKKDSDRDLHAEDTCGIMKNGVSEGDGWIRIHAYLTKDEKTNRVSVYDEDGDDRDEIFTAYRVVGVDTDEKTGETSSRLEVELITGKTHQIRAHLASIGHPLRDDKKYGGKGSGEYYLKAYKVIFPEDDRLDPAISGRTLTISESESEGDIS